MVDMYKLAEQQAKNVEVMVQLLTSIDCKLSVIVANQEEIYVKLSDIEDRIDEIEDYDLNDEDEDYEDYDLNDEDEDDLFEDDLFDDDFDPKIAGCDCDYCQGLYDEEPVIEEPSREEVELMAIETINELTGQPQLPYRFFSTTFYEYKPSKENPIQFIVNTSKRTVAALMKDEKGKVIKTSKSRCTPTDEFSPWIGAAIALHRLFEIEVPAVFVK